VDNTTLAAKVIDSTTSAAVSGQGFSFNVFNNTPTSGYMVALSGYEHIVESGDDIEQHIAAYVHSNFGLLMGNATLYVGGWFNDGKLYLDISESFQDVRKAKIAGAKRHQIAIWDVVYSREIVL